LRHKVSKSIHVCQSYNKPKVGRFLGHGVECGPMPNVRAALPNIGGALCQRRKVWLTPTTIEYRAVTMPRHEIRRNLLGSPKLANISAASGPKFIIIVRTCGKYMLYNKFFRLSIRALVAKIYGPTKLWDGAHFTHRSRDMAHAQWLQTHCQ